MRRDSRVLIALLLASILLDGCASAPPPVLPDLRLSQPKTPVIYVPGSTGTVLRDRDSQRIVWGRGRQLVLPRDGGYAIARPLDFAIDSEMSRLEPTEAIHEIRLAGIFSQDVYGPTVDLLEANGYRFGDLSAPAPADTAFLFPYDWRLDHRLAAGQLLDRLEALRQARGEEVLAVDLVCQSNGAYICRYLAKYGDAPLAAAEAGSAGPPEWLTVRKIILLGNSNGGSLRMLRELNRGRTYIAIVGRKLRPEVVFTAPAFFQDLPMVKPDLFLDAAGEPLGVDLFDAESWRRFGWSIFAPAARQRIASARDVFGDEAKQLVYLQEVLDYARRFHAVLLNDAPGFGDTRYYLLQSKTRDTPERAVLIETDDGWQTLFSTDKALQDMAEIHRRATAMGDGHGTVESQLWLSPQEKDAIAAEPFYLDDDHFELILRPEIHRRMLDFLHDDSPAPGDS